MTSPTTLPGRIMKWINSNKRDTVRRISIESFRDRFNRRVYTVTLDEYSDDWENIYYEEGASSKEALKNLKRRLKEDEV